MGETLPFFQAARIWFLASLGKYVPGKVWAIAGAAVLAQRAGVDPSVAVAGAIVLQILALASGAAVVPLTSQPALDKLSRLLPASWPKLQAIPAGMVVAAFLANVLAWVGYGVAL